MGIAMRRKWSVSLLVVLLLGGCAENHSRESSARKSRDENGVDKKSDDLNGSKGDSSKSPMRLEHAACMAVNSRYASATASGVWLPDAATTNRFESDGDGLVRLDVFYVMHGPTIPPNHPDIQYGSYSALLGPQSVATLNDDGLQLQEGWLYMTGWYPWVQTSRANAGAEGSRFIIRVFRANPSDPEMTQWVFRVGGNTWVKAGTNSVQQQSADGHYWVLPPTAGNADFVEHALTPSSDPNSPYVFFNRALARGRLLFP